MRVRWCSCRDYAAAIAEVLDPTGKLFGGRIIAKESLEGVTSQTEKRLMQVHMVELHCGRMQHDVQLAASARCSPMPRSEHMQPGSPCSVQRQCMGGQGLEQLETLALIIDDSSEVWELHKASLVTVERYVFFPSSRHQLGMSQSYFEKNRCALQQMC